ncbi:cyclase family protein [Tepidibacter hydrothermalis]|uniref:Cyclase family protein n=1 Tax=Tepidibacter hydrothermalis TaxID=3036126 RepID=A0ABY8EJP7_9FIRM|nr:cyclase family protein [Tepidibacter hydrothermalis]WFD12042.1 cyclase family protein [Tepidibacter hydrothermalis]
MNIIDLTHLIYPNMPVFPGTDTPVLEKANTIEKDGFCEMKMTMYSHTGTHIDAPAHMLKDGVTLDKLDVNNFIGTAIILEFKDKKHIKLKDILPYKDKIAKSDFVIIKTGWSKFWGKKEYFEEFPSINIDVANWLVNFNLKGIGVDAISIDDMKSTSFEVHKTLMKNNLIIIENLTNLEKIEDTFFTLTVLPLKTLNADGAPVRAIAVI